MNAPSQTWIRWLGWIVFFASAAVSATLGSKGQVVDLPALLWVAILPAATLALWLRERRRMTESDASFPPAGESLAPLLGLCGGLGLYLASRAVHDPWFAWQPWLAPEAATLAGSRLARTVLLGLLLTPLFYSRWRRAWLILLALLIAAQAVCLRALWLTTGGAPLCRDDHPSFLFRLWAFARSLPHLVCYNPLWNAGREDATMVSSGLTGIGLALWPLWRWTAVHTVYTGALAFVFFALVPAMAAGSARLAGGRGWAMLSAALLALTPGYFFFLWTFHFGTVGAGFSSACILPLAAALARTLKGPGAPPWPVGVLLAGSAALFLGWPPNVFFAGALALGVLAAGSALADRRKLIFLTASAAAIAVLCLPYLFSILRHTDPAGFAHLLDQKGSLAKSLGAGLTNVRGLFLRSNPMLLFLGLGGACFLPRGALRRFWIVTLLGLLAFAGWGEIRKPQFQLTRAGIPLMFAAAIPAALVLERLFQDRRRWLAPVQAGLAACLLAGGWGMERAYRNKIPADISAWPPQTVEMAGWIRQHVPADARLVFLGFTLHGYGGGHVAYLPVLTGRQMMACDYYHFSPKKVEYDYPPRPWREEDEDVMAFLDLYNASHVSTWQPQWKKFCRRHPEWFEEAATFGRRQNLTFFRVRRDPPGWFLENAGTVAAEINRLRVTVRDPNRTAVIRYHWDPGLRAPAPVTIGPYDAGRDVRLIRIEPNGRASFDLTYRP